MLTRDELLNGMAHATGTTGYLRHKVVPSQRLGLLLTDGAKYLAEGAGAWWLMDAILSHAYTVLTERRDLVRVTLTVAEDRSATLTFHDGHGRTYQEQRIPHTDFPLTEVTMLLGWAWPDGTLESREACLMLTSEY